MPTISFPWNLPLPKPIDQYFAQKLAVAKEHKLDRHCPAISEASGIVYRLQGDLVTSFCSNDYLGFAQQRLQVHSTTGSASSRLVCGDHDDVRQLETQLAKAVAYPDAILFPSGFQLNTGVLATLFSAGDDIYSDRLNHASIIDGIRLSPAKAKRLPHLSPPPAATDSGPSNALPPSFRWWITEGRFSMDGDLPSLADLSNFMNDEGCLYLDEAHSFGLDADGLGRGALLPQLPDISVFPLGKAFGCAGAFLAASTPICDWIRGHARSFVFSTGMSPLLVAAIAQRLPLLLGQEGQVLRAKLWENHQLFFQCLKAPPPNSYPSPIIPIIIGDNGLALQCSAELLAKGWHVQPIRPPTVPLGSARLRITLSALHSPQQIRNFCSDLMDTLNRHGLPLRFRPEPSS